MILNDIDPTFTWNINTSFNPDIDLNDQKQVLEYYQPRIVFNQSRSLNETNYKDIIAFFDDDFLKQKKREAELKIVEFDRWRKNNLIFLVPSLHFATNGIKYRNIVQFIQWDQMVKDMTLKPIEAANLLLWGSDLKLHCDCPSFLYHGFKYILTVLDASIQEEDRHPKIRNPGHRGIVCKHLRKTMGVLQFHNTTLSGEINKLRQAAKEPTPPPETPETDISDLTDTDTDSAEDIVK